MRKSKNIITIIIIVVVAVAMALYVKNSREKKQENQLMDNASEKPAEKVPEKDKNKEKLDKVQAENNYFYISSEEDYNKVIDDDKPLILMFGTKVCTFCAQMRPYVNEISNLYKDKVNIRYIDAGEIPDVAYKYPIKGVPALMIRNADKTGFTPSEDLFAKLSDNYNAPTAYSKSDSKKHDFTMTYGLIKRDLMVKIVEELIDNVK